MGAHRARKGAGASLLPASGPFVTTRSGASRRGLIPRFVRPKFGTLMDAGKADVLAFTAWPSITQASLGRA